MNQNFSIKFFQFLTGRQRCVESGVVVMKNVIFPIQSGRFLSIAWHNLSSYWQ